MVFITGPRQVGKTFLAKSIQRVYLKPVYLNNDDITNARIIRNRFWPLNTDLVILDEIHKMKGWKKYLNLQSSIPNIFDFTLK
ncbi:MAG: AAA family ATPase [Candidatus Firestonebacteria bacterium]